MNVLNFIHMAEYRFSNFQNKNATLRQKYVGEVAQEAIYFHETCEISKT